MKNSRNECVNCVFKSEAALVLSKEELAVLDESCYKNTYSKGELIFKQGAPFQHIVYLRSGLVKLLMIGSSKKEYILSVTKPGSYLGIQNLTKKNKVNYYSAKAIIDSEVCHINTDSFYELIKKNGKFAIEVISAILNDEMNYFERLVDNVQQQMPGRLASALFYFCKQVYNQNPFELNLTRSELASLVGSSRESVSRILMQFHDSGIINIEKDKIKIIDEERLMKIREKG